MDALLYIALFVFGSVLGSFLGALTYRVPRDISIIKGRSRCPKCKKTIAWYDNVPLVSYLLLKGKCRNCNKTISRRYFFIELATGAYFMLSYQYTNSFFCGDIHSPYCFWQSTLGANVYLLNLFIFLVLFAIFVIDIEKQVIPDNLIFFGVFLVTLLLILFSPGSFYYSFFSGLIAASFLLFINIVTKGKGMGLGDVKLAILAGFLLGWPLTVIWLFVAFLTGAIVGIILILGRETSFGKSIAFGPFLVFSFFLVYIFGDKLFLLII